MYRNGYLQASAMADKIASGETLSDSSSRRKQQQAGIMSRISYRAEQESQDEHPSEMIARYISLIRSGLEEEGPLVEDDFVTDMAELDTGELPKGITKPKDYNDVVYENTKLEQSNTDYKRIAEGLSEAANELGMDVIDLATIVSYETAGTFSPTKVGPTTKWGQHKGLIQFGEPQAKSYGVDWSDPYGSQLGRDGAIVKYFRASGYKPGMGLLDAYSIVNAGGPGLYHRSDESAGGAPGTVRDKVNNQMAGHRAKARRLIEEYL
jgi:hypothetical protein